MTTATLTASSDPGSRGRQRISAILGAHKGKLELRQLGRDSSSCGTAVECTPGLYLVTDAATSTKVRNGGSVSTTERYMLVWDDETTGRAIEITETQALDIASRIGAPMAINWSLLGREATVALHRDRLAATSDRPDDKIVNVLGVIGQLAPGPHTMGEIRAARRAELQRLTGGPTDLPIELDGGPTDPRARKALLLAEADQLHARLAAIDVELRALDAAEATARADAERARRS